MERKIDQLPGKGVHQSKNFFGARQSLVEITGNCRVLIENHKGVAAYTNEIIQVKSSNGPICIRGTCLTLECISKYQLVITGCIHSVSVGMGDDV